MNDTPRALRCADALATVEQRIAEALPDIIDRLIDRARCGDIRTAVYLCDRLMGRTAGAKAAPADDREPPYSEETARHDQAERDSLQSRPRILIPDADPRSPATADGSD